MLQDARCPLIFLSMILLVPLLFWVTYAIWPLSHLLALALLFSGMSLDLLVGLLILDHALI